MTDKPETTSEHADNTAKDPEDWKTGDESMPSAQRSYPHTLASEAGA